MRSIRLVLVVLAFLLLAGGASLSTLAQSGRRPVYEPPNSQRTTPAQQSNAQTDRNKPSTADQSESTELKSSPGAVSNTPDTDEAIKVDTTLVTIPVTAMDNQGRYVPNLKKSDFRLYEDGVEQEIESFGAVEVPFNVVLLLDTSGSTEEKLIEIQQAAVTFVEQLRPQDQVMVVSFDEDVHIDCEFTSDRSRLRRAIYRTYPGGSTRLFDAVDLVITERLNQMQGRKAIVLFTDGKDTSSKLATGRSTIARIEESDILVYPIHYDTLDMRMSVPGMPGPRSRRGGGNWPYPFPDPRNRRWPFDSMINYQFPQGGGQNSQRGRTSGKINGENYLRALADASGGRMFYAESITNLSQAFSSIAEELRHQYTLSYYPTNPANNGEWKQVRVRSNQPGVIMRSKEGYRVGKAPDTKASSPSEEKRPTLKRSIAEF
ncbi:MAG TPA: VWA domain-containing protein [Blastocatellia bacterium]|nr:VWA domain-containing protein [Blastocatellia bacterium]